MECSNASLEGVGKILQKRDVEQVDKCIDDTMLPDELLILGTNPREIFLGRERAKSLLWGDWKYWGQVEIDTERAVLNRVGSAVYFVVRGQVKLDIWHFRTPIKMTGVLKEKDGRWYISKLQFTNDLMAVRENQLYQALDELKANKSNIVTFVCTGMDACYRNVSCIQELIW